VHSGAVCVCTVCVCTAGLFACAQRRREFSRSRDAATMMGQLVGAALGPAAFSCPADGATGGCDDGATDDDGATGGCSAWAFSRPAPFNLHVGAATFRVHSRHRDHRDHQRANACYISPYFTLAELGASRPLSLSLVTELVYTSCQLRPEAAGVEPASGVVGVEVEPRPRAEGGRGGAVRPCCGLCCGEGLCCGRERALWEREGAVGGRGRCGRERAPG
jgi:hypothetical protein